MCVNYTSYRFHCLSRVCNALPPIPFPLIYYPFLPANSLICLQGPLPCALYALQPNATPSFFLLFFSEEREFMNFCEKYRLCAIQRLEMQNSRFWQKVASSYRFC